MKRNETDILRDLADSVIEMEEKKAADLAREAIEAKIDAYTAIIGGLSKGMEIVGRKYESGEYFVPELLLCSDAMYSGISVLRPHMKEDAANTTGRIIIGVVEGDSHDIGKNLVKIMLESAGFDVHDLGRDVPLNRFITEAQRLDARMVCMSTLMTTSMGGMVKVINLLKAEGMRDQCKVMVGGGPVTRLFSDKIGADGYAPNAADAVRKAKELLSSTPDKTYNRPVTSSQETPRS